MDSDSPVPMDCSPPMSSRPSAPPSPISTKSVKLGRNKGKNLCLKLAKQGDKMWTWVKEGCSRKRAATSHEPATPPLTVEDANSAILACLKPFKKRRGDPKGGGSASSSSAFEGEVAPRSGPPQPP